MELPAASVNLCDGSCILVDSTAQQQQSGPRHVSSKDQVLKIYIMEVSKQACEI
jgi:hypothetical protein